MLPRYSKSPYLSSILYTINSSSNRYCVYSKVESNMEYVLHYCDEFLFDHFYGAAVNVLRYGAALATGMALSCDSGLTAAGTVNTTVGTLDTLLVGGCSADAAAELSTLILARLLPESLWYSIIPYVPDFTSRDDTLRQIV